MLRRAAPYDPPAALQERRLMRWTLAACGLMFLALAAPALLGRVYSADDLGAFHLPLRHFYAQRLANGDAFDWAPGLFCGFFLTGDGQVGGYHPLHWILYRVLPLSAAFNLELLLSYPFMLAGTYLFLRRQLGRRDAALFGGLLFTFCGFNLLHFVHPNAIAVVAHLPWLLWCLDVALDDSDRPRNVGVAGIALLTGSQLLLGYPQYVWFCLLTSAAWTSYRLLATRSDAAKPRPRRLVAIAAALLVGLLIGAVQLLPTFDALATSRRAAEDADFGLVGPLHPGNLLQLVAPYLFRHRVADSDNTHEFGLYCGAVPLMLIVWLIVQRRDLGQSRRLALAAALFALIAIVLAMGHYGGLYPLLARLPVVGRFRLPARFIVLFQFAVAMLSAIGFLHLCRRSVSDSILPWRQLQPLWKVVMLSVAVAIVCPMVMAGDRIAAWPLVVAGPLLIGAAALIVTMAARQVRGALVLLIVLAAFDQCVYGLSYAAWVSTSTPMPRNVPDLPADSSPESGRVMVQIPGGKWQYQEPNTLLLADARLIDGYAGLEPANRLDYRGIESLRAANCEFVARSAADGRINGLLPHDNLWLRVPSPLPRFQLVAQVELSSDPGTQLDRIDISTTALSEAPLGSLAGPIGQLKSVHDRPGDIQVRVDLPARQLLVVSERFHPGWTATIDNRPQRVFRLNGDFFGCPIDAGTHDVRFTFRPESLLWGRRLTLLGIAVASLWLLGVCFIEGPFLRSTKHE